MTLSPSFEIKRTNMTKTIQSAKVHRSSEKVLYSSRFFSRSAHNPLPGDVPVNYSLLAKDAVRSLISGEKADKATHGRRVDLIGKEGERVRVVSRMPREDATGAHTMAFGDENSTLRYLKSEDRPDFLYAVFVNFHTKAVDFFRVPVSPADIKKPIALSSIRYSPAKRSYNSGQKYLVASVPFS